MRELIIIHFAIRKGDLSVLIWLRRSFDIKFWSWAFMIAAGEGHLHVCKWLMALPERYGIDPAAQSNSAFIMAAEEGHLDLCKWLLSLPKHYDINPAAQYNNALRWAAENCQDDLCKWLLSLPGVKDPR